AVLVEAQQPAVVLARAFHRRRAGGDEAAIERLVDRGEAARALGIAAVEVVAPELVALGVEAHDPAGGARDLLVAARAGQHEAAVARRDHRGEPVEIRAADEALAGFLALAVDEEAVLAPGQDAPRRIDAGATIGALPDDGGRAVAALLGGRDRAAIRLR